MSDEKTQTAPERTKYTIYLSKEIGDIMRNHAYFTGEGVSEGIEQACARYIEQVIRPELLRGYDRKNKAWVEKTEGELWPEAPVKRLRPGKRR